MARSAFHIIMTLFFVKSCSLYVAAQPVTEWTRSLSEMRAVSSGLVFDGAGGYYLAGRYGADGWVARVDSAMQIRWERGDLGGSGMDAFQRGSGQLCLASSGAVLVAGSSTSDDGLLGRNAGDHDAWLLMMGPDGSVQWSRSYGSSAYDVCTGLMPDGTGGYLALINSYGTNGDFRGGNGQSYVWVVQLGPEGQWLGSKSYGGSGRDFAFDWLPEPDGGVVIAARSESMDGDLADAEGTPALWLFKLDVKGEIVWSETFAGLMDNFHLARIDSGYLVCGTAAVSTHYFGNKGKDDGFVIRTDMEGRMLWAQNYGGSAGDYLSGLGVTSAGEILLTGSSFSSDGDLTTHRGKGDCWVMKTDGDGRVLWSQNYGGSNGDSGLDIWEAFPGRYHVHLYQGSYDGDFAGGSPGPAILSLNDTGREAPKLNVRIASEVADRRRGIRLTFAEQGPFIFTLKNSHGELAMERQVRGPEIIVQTKILKPGLYFYTIAEGRAYVSGRIILY